MGQPEEEATESDGSSPGADDGGSVTKAVERLETVDPGNIADVLGLGPEECLYRLVEEHGGRLPQGRLVELVPWSAATVSRLLSTLEEQGRVVRFHAGRGKVVFLEERSPGP